MLGGMDGRYSQRVNKSPETTQESPQMQGENNNQKTDKVAKKTLTKSTSEDVSIQSKPKANFLTAALQKFANKISNFFSSILGSKSPSKTDIKGEESIDSPSKTNIEGEESIDNEESCIINKKGLIEILNSPVDKNGPQDAFERDSIGGGAVNGTIIFGNERISIPALEEDSSEKDLNNNYTSNAERISNFMTKHPDLKICEKLLRTLMSQTIATINEKSSGIKKAELDMKFLTKQIEKKFSIFGEPKNTFDYTFTIKKSENVITIEVRGTNRFEYVLKDNNKQSSPPEEQLLPPKEQLDPVIVDVKFDIVIDKNKNHIASVKEGSEEIDKIVDFEIINDEVTHIKSK